jgi:hypothetical protein
MPAGAGTISPFGVVIGGSPAAWTGLFLQRTPIQPDKSIDDQIHLQYYCSAKRK